ACNACHELVPKRDYVFSQPVDLAIGQLSTDMIAPASSGLGVTFETVAAKDLPEKARAVLPPGTKEVRLVEGSMRKHMFQGTIDELLPSREKEAAASNLPAALVNEEGSRFSIVLPGGPGGGCAKGEVAMTAFYTVNPPGSGQIYPVVSSFFCEQ